VTQSVETLRYKPEGSRIFQWLSFRPLYGPRMGSVSNRNEDKGYLPGVKAAGA